MVWKLQQALTGITHGNCTECKDIITVSFSIDTDPLDHDTTSKTMKEEKEMHDDDRFDPFCNGHLAKVAKERLDIAKTKQRILDWQTG